MLKLTHDYKFWFVAGSQFLYGEEQLKNVARDAEDIVKKLNESGKLPYPIEFKGVMTTADGITQFMKDVNYNDDVAGVITWMHTFSPAKNWIRGTKLLQKPLLHLATQYLNKIPYDTIDFDYMNLNQSAHGDREYGYLNARLGLNNKIVYGWWGDAEVQDEIASWEDVAVAYNESFHIKVCRFGDTMRNVAVTEGDKVQAQIQLGWTVDYWPVGDLVEVVDAFNLAAQQQRGFVKIGCDHGGQRKQFVHQHLHGFACNQPVAAGGHHHRVEHHVLRVVRGQTVGDHGDELGAGHHADLHRHRRNVFEHRVDLRRKHFRGSVGDHRHAGGVLRGQRRDRGHAEHAVGEHGLQIRLNAGTAGRIRSCDTQYRWQCASHGNSPY